MKQYLHSIILIDFLITLMVCPLVVKSQQIQHRNPLSSVFQREGGPLLDSTTNTKKSNIAIQTNAVPSAGNGIVDKTDVAVYPSGNDQSEVHLSINRQNPSILVLSCNTYLSNYNQGRYVSTDGGATWSGSDQLDPNVAKVGGDPSTAIDANGNIYISTITNGEGGYSFTKSTNNGSSFSSLTSGVVVTPGTFDKEMIATDDKTTSPYANYLYAAWTTFGSTSETVNFNRSTNGGSSFSAPITLKNGPGQGANVQTGPNGEVYVCYADYGSSGTLPASGLGFVKSLDGGITFTSAQVVVSYTGIRASSGPDPLFNNIRVNDFPAMAVDKTGGVHNGRIYVVFAAKQNGNGKAVIELTYSDNQGSTWSTPQEISISTGQQSFFPWIAVDEVSGSIYIAYYCIDGSNFSTNTYCAISNDGGSTFTNQIVSDVPHITQPINNSRYAAGYEGDYIGVTSNNGKGYVGWMDERTGTWQAYVSEVDYYFISGPSTICGSASYSINNLPQNATVTWSASPSSAVSLTPSGNNVTVTDISGGSIVLTANITVGGNSTTTTKNITLSSAISPNGYVVSKSGACPANGAPVSIGVTYNNNNLCYCSNITAVDWQVIPNGSTPYQITWNQGIYSCSSVDKAGFSLVYNPPAQNYPPPITFRFRLKNSCGAWGNWSPGFAIFTNSNCSTNVYLISPNPATSSITIQPASSSSISTNNTNGSTNSSTTIAPNITQVKIYNNMGKLVMTQNFAGNANKVQLVLNGFNSGIYYIDIITANYIEKQALQIN